MYSFYHLGGIYSGGVVYDGEGGTHRLVGNVMFDGVVLLRLRLYGCYTARVLLKFEGIGGWNRPCCCVQDETPT